MTPFPRFFSLLLLPLGSWLSAAAQATWHLGPLVSANAGSIHYQSEAYHNGAVVPAARAGFAAGLGAWHPVATHWAIQPSVRYVRRGFTFDETNQANALVGTTLQTSTSIYHATVTCHQVEVPVQVNYYFTQAGTGFFLLGGITVSALLGGNRRYDNQFLTAGQSLSVAGTEALRVRAEYPQSGDTQYSLRRWDLGLQEGIGYHLRQFQVQCSYRVGVLNTATASSYQLPSPHSYTRLAEVQVGYFGL